MTLLDDLKRVCVKPEEFNPATNCLTQQLLRSKGFMTAWPYYSLLDAGYTDGEAVAGKELYWETGNNWDKFPLGAKGHDAAMEYAERLLTPLAAAQSSSESVSRELVEA